MIDNGSEIFGDNYIKSDGTLANNGFDALADLDSNNDGVIDANDNNFSMIKILKGDGSILSLEDAGIQSIGLNYSQQNSTDANGNTLVHSGSFTKNDGTNGQIGDFILQYDKLNSVATEWVDVPDDVAILPDAAGSGEVYSLHQAMAKDSTGELKNLVNAFLDATDNMQKLGIVKNIILKWTGADTISSDSRGEFIDARELTALEKFMGQEFSGIAEQGSSESTFPNSQAANILNAAFSALVEHVYAQLFSQTSMKFLYDMINFEVDINSGAAMLDLTDVTEYLKTQILQDKSNGDNLLAEFNRTFINLGLKNYGNYNDFYESFVSMDASYEVLFSVSEKTVVYGTDDNDSISTNAGDDAIYGGDGDDYMVSA